jgi:hypothetical protein
MRLDAYTGHGGKVVDILPAGLRAGKGRGSRRSHFETAPADKQSQRTCQDECTPV